MTGTRSAQELLHFVVAAGGNLPLAAERAGVSRQDLVALITGGETNNLAESLRAMIMLSLFDNIQQTAIAFRANLPYMSPDAVAKAYAAQIASFAQISQTPTPELNAETHDAAAAKQNLVTRLESWKNRGPKIVDVEANVEDVS